MMLKELTGSPQEDDAKEIVHEDTEIDVEELTVSQKQQEKLDTVYRNQMTKKFFFISAY